jgi:hypothetical protein
LRRLGGKRVKAAGDRNHKRFVAQGIREVHGG